MIKGFIISSLFIFTHFCKPSPISIKFVEEEVQEEEVRVSHYENVIPFLENLKALIIEEKIKEEDFLNKMRKSFRSKINAEKKFLKLLKKIYKEREFLPIFSNSNEISKNVEIMLNAVLELPLHGLKNEKYPFKEMQNLIAEYSKLKEEYSQAREKLFEPPLRKIIDAFLKQNEIPSLERIYEIVFKEHSPTGEEEKEIPSFKEFKRIEREIREEFFEVMQKLDILVLKSFFLYALDFKYIILAHPFKALKEIDKADEIFQKNLYEDFNSAIKDFPATLLSFIPKHPYYKQTMKGLEFYKKLRDEGNIKRINFSGTLKINSRGEVVKKLKERLYYEEYFKGEINSFFDKSLEDAVKEYQKTHQYTPNGVVDRALWVSLNKSMSERVKEIELSLQRWRESEIKTLPPLYVRVNIPEFAMEVWEGENLIKKHKVIVGNDNWDINPKERIVGRINRTKIFSTKISEIILNPLWHVPPRIKSLELDFELYKEPDYYEKYDYKVILNPDGTETVYQKESPENVLGKIKFLFPNKYGIFMHDTPLKELFKENIRAFSHGCIRLENPLDIGYYFLEKINGMKKEEVDAILAKDEETSIKLIEKIPIYVEYNTVSVDSEGRMMFFSDKYKYNKDYWDGKIPYSPKMLRLLERKIPKID